MVCSVNIVEWWVASRSSYPSKGDGTLSCVDSVQLSDFIYKAELGTQLGAHLHYLIQPFPAWLLFKH